MHYARDGGWYPKGGSEILAKRMVECIYKHGGKVLCKANVKKILVENGKVCGVEMIDPANGSSRRIMVPEVISTVGIIASYNLLDEQYQDARYHAIQKKMDYGVFCCYMFIGFKGTSEENKINSYNHWVHQDVNFEACQQLSDDPYDEKNRKTIYFVSSNSAKDPEYE